MANVVKYLVQCYFGTYFMIIVMKTNYYKHGTRHSPWLYLILKEKVATMTAMVMSLSPVTNLINILRVQSGTAWKIG